MYRVFMTSRISPWTRCVDVQQDGDGTRWITCYSVNHCGSHTALRWFHLHCGLHRATATAVATLHLYLAGLRYHPTLPSPPHTHYVRRLPLPLLLVCRLDYHTTHLFPTLPTLVAPLHYRRLPGARYSYHIAWFVTTLLRCRTHHAHTQLVFPLTFCQSLLVHPAARYVRACLINALMARGA